MGWATTPAWIALCVAAVLVGGCGTGRPPSSFSAADIQQILEHPKLLPNELPAYPVRCTMRGANTFYCVELYNGKPDGTTTVVHTKGRKITELDGQTADLPPPPMARQRP